MSGNTFYFQWEVLLIEWIQNIMGPAGTGLASFLTFWGEELLIVLVLAFLYWVYDKQFARFVGTNIMVGLLLNPILKNTFLRRRPYFDTAQIQCLKPSDAGADIYDIAAQGYSFPSGHSTNSAVFYGSMAMYKKKNRILLLISIALPLLIGISRVMLGVHYPTDVMAGWVLGTVILILISYLQTRIKKQGIFHLVLFLLACIGAVFCRTSDYFTGLGLMAGFFLSIPFEERFVNFPQTRKLLPALLRIVGGFIIFVGLNTLLKMPFPEAFLEQPILPAFLIRSVRYMIIIFILLAIYPILFGKIENKISR